MLLSLLFAGHDTTSTALTSLFATLPSHPGVMAKLREEQAQLVARHGPGASAALLKDMKYGDAVVRWGCCSILVLLFACVTALHV